MSWKLLVNNFEWIKDTFKDFTKNYIEESDKRYFLEVHVQYTKKLLKLYNYLPFLPERMEIEKVEMPVANLIDKTEYLTYIRNFK